MVAVPRRGQIFEVDWNPARGSEQAGIRPALVVQNDIGNASAPTTIVAAITSREPRKPYPFLVELVGTGLPKRSWAHCSQLHTVDKARLGRMLGAAGPEVLRQVDAALRHSLSIPDPQR
jgi:mRNA interferase MazF